MNRVGLLWGAEGLSGPTDPFCTTGGHVAAAALARALACHGEVAHVDIFAPISDVDACRQQLRGVPESLTGAEVPVTHCFPESDIAPRLRAARYDVLHDTTTALTAASYARARFSEHLFPVTCSQHGISYSFGLLTGFIPLLTAQVYPCDAIVCLTRASRRAMENRLGQIAAEYSRAWDRPSPRLPRLEEIPWGVDTERFAPRDRAVARRDLNLPLDRPIVLCVGRVRIEDKMDWTPLLLAFDHVRRTTREHPLFVLAGSTASEYSQQVIGMAAQLGLRESVRTFFNAPSACLAPLYAACDLFVSPGDSPSESFGLTIIEAMACGRPVVASDWDGYRDLIRHGETGFKVRTDWADCLGEFNEVAPTLSWRQQHLHVGQSVSVDVSELAGYVARLIENGDLREQMGRQARARVEALYAWPVVMRRWRSLWAELGAIACTIQEKEEDRLDFLKPSYFEQFSHYASRIVDEDTPIRLTPRGRECLLGRTPLLLHPWARGFLQPDSLQCVLTALRPAGWLGGTMSVGRLVAALQRGQRMSRDQVMMHLMWLSKYDLVALGGEVLSCEEASES